MIYTLRTVLIVDDSPEDRALYRRYLLRDDLRSLSNEQAYSYTFLEAELGQQGLDLWQQHQPDVLLLDYRLSDLDGVEFLDRLYSASQTFCLPVIVITGQGNEMIAVEAMKAGAQDYLVKEQITPEGLQLAINRVIETVQLRAQLQQRIERERVVAQITQQVHQSLDLEDVLQTIVTEVRHFLHTDRVLVFQLQPDGNGTVIAESVGVEWQSLFSSTIYDPCLAKNYLRFSCPESVTHDIAFAEEYVQRYRQGQVTAIPDIHSSNIDPCHVELLARFQVRANLVVPILHDGQFWGLLIAHHCAGPRSWQPLEIDLLKELTAPVSLALRQAELYRQAQYELAERQQVEAELRESEERLRLALEAAHMGTWDWDIQTGQISWSENLEALFGLEPGEFDGSFEMFADCLHPDDRKRVLAAIDQAIATGADYDIEFHILYPNGTIRWVLAQGKVFYGPNGQPLRMAGIDMDITERKRSEAVLQESEERFRQLAENINVVFWMKEASETRVRYISPAYERLWGLNPQELYESQRAWVNYIHPDDRESVDRAFQEKASAGQFDQEYRIVLADGSIRWVHDRCFPLRDETGTLYRFTGIAEDITDRKRSEKALKESEERFRTSVENMLDCFGIYRAIRNEQGEIVDFRTEYVNDAACLNNRMTREQQIGRGLCELMPGHRTHGLFDEYCQVVETGQPLIKENLIYQGDGKQERLIRAFDICVAKLGDGYVATWRNITDRKQTEAVLRRNEQLLRLALAGAHAGSWDWEIQTGKIAWSPENFALYGLDPTQITLQYEDWYNALHPDDRERVSLEVAHVVEARLSNFHTEFRIIHPQQGIRWLLGLGRLILNEQGEPIRLSGINLDITDRKQGEQRLYESEERLQLGMQVAGFALAKFDYASNTAELSPETAALYGLPIDQLIVPRERIHATFHPEEQAELAQLIQQVLDPTGTGWFSRDHRIVWGNGEVRWLAVRKQVFFDHSGASPKPTHAILAALDITDRKFAEVERERLLAQEQVARAEAERANRIKDDFLAILSHELRSPLNPILGWAKLLQTRKFDEARTAEALATIERNAKLQTQLIDDLLDVAKILRGKLSMDTAPVNLVVVIEAAIDTVRTAAVSKSILLHPVLSQIGQVAGDSARLQQIVWNLLSNAIKFTPSQGQVDIRLERVGNQAQITVCDTGKGIRADFLPHLFETFHQEDASITRTYGGLGLGLAIVRSLVEAHGGTIAADSPGEGQGATFTVKLPLLDAELETSQPDKLTEQDLDLTGMRILAVDDEPDARELLSILLSGYGAEVLIVTTAAEVLTALKSFQPDALISDIGMPKVDGYTLIRQIRALPADQGGQIPAIALTAYAREEDHQRAIDSGYQRQVTKPLEPERLVQALIAIVYRDR